MIEKLKKTFEKLLLKTSFAVYFLIVIAAFCILVVYAAFADSMKTNSSFLTGTLSVALEEDAPFDDPDGIPLEGSSVLIKTFRAISEGNQSAYVRVELIPIVEIYDEELEKYVAINIDQSLVILDIDCNYWIPNGGYYYYKYILNAGESSEDVKVTFMGFDTDIDYSNLDIRVTVRVELESAQIHNDAWKRIFSIEHLPEGVEKL